MPYYAHTREGEPEERWQPLREHLLSVASLASEFAREALPNNPAFVATARLAGLLHDLGKYRPEFQLMLRGQHPRNEKTWHKQPGAAYAASKLLNDVAFAIAGHHGGLPNREDLKHAIKGPQGLEISNSIWSAAIGDCAELEDLPRASTHVPSADDLLTRLLFSCLVDADWRDTTAFHRSADGLPPAAPPPPLDAANRLAAVLAFIERLAEGRRTEEVVVIRDEILRETLTSATQPIGTFAMAVPTGGGKTLASLAFALSHAAHHGLRRVIYVAPYLSIIEQNARQIRLALAHHGACTDDEFVFEHHSLSEPGTTRPDEPQTSLAARMAESWEAPVVITTSVQFFESLFSNQPGLCRKLHRIARSVVILDECQTLPPGLVAPTCSMLASLGAIAGASIVLCTATQPAWSRGPLLPEGLENVRAVVPAQLRLFERLKRVSVAWPVEDDPPLSWGEVAQRMAKSPAALCVVNTKRAARTIFRILREQGCDDARHLSTAMCPAHRLAVLDDVRQSLFEKRPCRLVSTQLIEAGVDVDFPVVLREMAPLESIIQAAGRCNREGRLPMRDGNPGGEVIVFRGPDGPPQLGHWYKAGIGVVEQDFLRNGRVPDVDEPADIGDYFSRLYHSGDLDRGQIQAKRRNGEFAEVDSAYRIIDEPTVSIVIANWDPARDEVAALLNRLRREADQRIFRRLGRFSVNLRQREADSAAGQIESGPCGIRIWRGPYDDCLGISNEQSVLLV